MGCLLWAAMVPASSDTPGPDPTDLVRKVIQRARSVSSDPAAPVCVFDKVSVYQYLEPDGSVRRFREKRYEVTLLRGMTFNRLVAVDGRELDAAESEALSENERRWRESYATGGRGGSIDRMDAFLNERLFSRFTVAWEGHAMLRGRRCHVLRVTPKGDDQPTDRLMDRVINQLHGRIWIDETESEIMRAEVQTEGPLRVWGGILGSLESLRLRVERDPTPMGVWFNRHLHAEVRGRKLFSRMHVRVEEIGSHPRPAPAQPASPAE